MGSDNDSGLSFPNYELISKSHNIKYFKYQKPKKLSTLFLKF